MDTQLGSFVGCMRYLNLPSAGDSDLQAYRPWHVDHSSIDVTV